MIVVTVADGMLGLIVDFKDMSRNTIDSLKHVRCHADAKEDAIRILHQYRYVHPMGRLDPLSRVVVNGNGDTGRETGQQGSDDDDFLVVVGMLVGSLL